MLSTESNNKDHQELIPVPRLLNASQVSEILGISTKTVNKLVREGKLGCVQVTTKERRFTQEQISAYIETQSKEPEKVRIDTPRVTKVSSPSKKGGERSFGVSKADLRKEMRRWQ
jgi:excisionase family DNA binding protein